MANVGKFEVTGGDETIDNIDKTVRLYARAVAAALYVEGAEIFAESQEQVPVDTGRLRSSGLLFIDGRVGSGIATGLDEIKIWVSYGTSYAYAVHEGRAGGSKGGKRGEPFKRRFKPARRRRRKLFIGPTRQKPKYLSDPFNKAAAGMEQRLDAEVRALVAQGGNPLAGKTQIRGKRNG